MVRWFLFILFTIRFVVGHSQMPSGGFTGTVIHKETKLPVEDVVVLVKGTSKQVQTNNLGIYTINGLKDGEYSLEFIRLGFQKVQYNDIRVTGGKLSTVNVELSPSGLGEEGDVKIMGRKKLIDVDRPSTISSLDKELIESQPVRQVQQLINSQPGVMNSPVGINIRGGRTYETGFRIDGVNATDPLSGTGFGMNLGSNSISELEITTGGIGADVGDATAGVVSAKTRTGGDKLEFSGVYKRDNFGNYAQHTSVWNQQLLEMNLGGTMKFASKPKPRQKLRYFVSLRGFFSDEYYRNPAQQLVSSLFPNTIWSPYQNNQWSGNIKLNWDYSARHRFSFTYTRSLAINQDVNMLRVVANDIGFRPGYQFLFQKQMDLANTFTQDGYLHILNYHGTPSKRFSHKATLSRFFSRVRADANGRPWRPTQVNAQLDPDNIVTFPATYFSQNDSLNFVNPADGFYNNGGIATLWHHHYFEEYSLQWNGTWYTSQTNKIYFGAESKFQEMEWIDITRPWVGAPIPLSNGTYSQSFRLGDASDIWKVRPRRGAVFVTDKIKYKGLIADVGFRFEYWAPGKFVDEAVANPDAPVRQEIRDEYMKTSVKLGNLRYKFRMLPRISASFPVRDKQMLYFNYGHTTILPHPSFVYQGLNPLYTDRSTLSRLGNPNLNPEVDISYEIGLKTELTSNDAFTVAAYVKDKYDFITSASLLVADPTGRLINRTVRINSDYARVRGLEVAYIKRIKTWFSSQLSIGWMSARGQSSSAQESLKELLATGAREDTREFYMAWDRPLDIKMNMTLKADDKKGWWSGRIKNYILYAEAVYRSGLRYTPYKLDGYEPQTNRPIYVQDPDPAARFSKIGTPWFWVDLNMKKWWNIKKVGQVALTLEVTNLFNIRNSSIINPVTGAAFRNGDDVPTEWQDPRFIDPRDPRSSNLPPTDPSRFLEQRHYMAGVSWKF